MPTSEAAIASECRAYFEEVVQRDNLMAGREGMARTLDDLYGRRLRLPQAQDRAQAGRAALLDTSAVLVEIAHDGQIPHLGVVRMILKTRQIASRLRNGLALYLIGDHYSADMRPRNLYLGLPLRGVDADHVKTPFTVSVGKHRRHVPFRWLPPPGEELLLTLEARALEWVRHNASFSDRSAAGDLTARRLQTLFDELRESARLTRSFGDWLMRLQILWLDRLCGGPCDRLVILPMSSIVEWLPDVLKQLADSAMDDSARADARTASHGFWLYCDRCHRRLRSTVRNGSFEARCPACPRDTRAVWPGEAARVMPDIEAFEMALFHSGISGWVVGSKADYIPVIEQAYVRRFGRRAPPTFLQTSVPKFYGIGEPADGHARSRLPRVFLEVDPPLLRAALEGPWDESPVIRSALL